MDKEQTKACIEVMQAYVDGKEIQLRTNQHNEWLTINSPSWDWAAWEYRIKPAPKIIYVNEYGTGGLVAFQAEQNARDVRMPSRTDINIAVPYIRLSDVDLLK